MFVIFLNKMEGVNLILDALAERAAEKGCIASGDLFQGVLKNLRHMDDSGNLTRVAELHETEEKNPDRKPISHLRVIK